MEYTERKCISEVWNEVESRMFVGDVMERQVKSVKTSKSSIIIHTGV